MASLASARLPAHLCLCVAAVGCLPAWLPSLPVPHSVFASPAMPPSQPSPAGHQLAPARQLVRQPAPTPTHHPASARPPARGAPSRRPALALTHLDSQPASPSSPRRTVQATGHQSSPLRQLVHPPPSIHPRPTLSVQHHAPSTRCHYSPSSIHPSIPPTTRPVNPPSTSHPSFLHSITVLPALRSTVCLVACKR